MMKIAIRRPRGRLVAVIVAAGCGLLALTPAAQELIDALLVRYQLHCLLAAQGDDASLYAKALAAHGPTALPQLAEALTSPRAEVAQATQNAMQREIATWDSLPPGEANRRLRVLSGALAERMHRLGPSARQLAVRQATRLLSDDCFASGNSDALRDCEAIVSATAGSGSRSAEQIKSAARLAADEATATRNSSAQYNTDAAHDRLIARALALPGGSLPILARETSPLAARELEATDEAIEESAATAEEARRSESSAMTPLRIAIGNEQGLARDSAAVTPILQIVPAPGVTQASAVQSEAARSRVKQAGYASKSQAIAALPGDVEDGVTLTSMYRLHDDDPLQVAAAEAELAERGFGVRELDLARRLTDDDPEVRRQLADILPGISGIDAKLWLTWLSRDRVADVRLAALTVMATTGHVQMLSHVAKVAGQDDDVRIQKLGEQLARPTAASRRAP